ncbi:peptidylprolyl isomerase (plasmid) [Pedobacter sp. BS3]|uniref:peptidylprolyl isomerase n=1 Tax=Pedobacter sp. BS3 TaxID=2567937 RepID=UPI0011EF3EFA|nr:peptidylprolyl isomerase [Pedobacter sp. BS3]TZF85766.1 peptidylprolyl isomerase [Pedobacter sp. BS3]
MKKLTTLLLLVATLTTYAKKPLYQYVRISTSKGECIVRLYNQTPLHRDNFVKLANAGYFNGTLFHRVINGFMVQGGDPTSKNAQPGQLIGEGGPGYTIKAEFSDSLFHKKGALAAARDNNPEKASNGSQFYLVQGRTYTDEELNRLEQIRLNGRKIPAWQREIYKTVGGTPFLDQNYTVFGEIVKGLPMVDSIAQVATDSNNRPLEDVKMQVSVLKKREVRQLEKELMQGTFKKKLFMNIKLF